MPSEALDEAGQVACLDQVYASLRRSSLVGIPASTLLALTLWSTVATRNLVAFVVLVWVADVVTFIVTGRYFARRRSGATAHRCCAAVLVSGAVGAAWGSLALVALPDSHHAALRAVYLIFACGVSATLVVGAAAARRVYFAGQLPMLIPIAARYLIASDGTTRMLGLAVPIYFVVMTVLHDEVHRLVVSEVNLRSRNDEANAKLLERVLRDELTGLGNRAAFIEALTKATLDSDDGLVGLVYLDVDRFKVVNDSLGHVAGDELLKLIGARIQRIIPPDDLLARVGGDEFTILLTGLLSQDEAVARANRVLAAFAKPFDIDGRVIDVTASIGVATRLNEGDDAKTLLAHADAAQYRAKEGGRNRIEVFDVRLREVLARQLDDEQDLRRALNTGEIVAWFQPIVDLSTGRIVAAEALARWKHPTRGVLEAGRFIGLAEESGLVDQLDREVATAAFAARAELHRLGVPKDFRIWCNVSATQFAKSDPTVRLVAALQRSGCDPTGVGIEITETAILRDVQSAAAEVRAARDLGVEVALDDFGTGHSSLTLLRDLRIDKVKIDRSFVREATKAGADAAIIGSVIGLANQLQIDVVAEGVETPEQAHLLREFGCRYAQGFLWSRARPLTELIEQIAAWNRAPQLVERFPSVDTPTASKKSLSTESSR